MTEPPGSTGSEVSLGDEWDRRYAALSDGLAGLRPNGVLCAEVGGLAPGRALDVGCGAGADAVWLAERGWRVTGLDVSAVALEHAARRADAAGVEVTWLRGALGDPASFLGLADRDSGAGPDRGHHLVTAFYPAIRKAAGGSATDALLGAVAPGGTLVVVHHADVDVKRAKSHGFDPADFVGHGDVVALLGDDWEVRVMPRRPRERPTGPMGEHTHDDVIVARRRGRTLSPNPHAGRGEQR